jgi:uncharacterized protein
MAGEQDVITRSRNGQAPPPRTTAVLPGVIAVGGAGFAVLAGLDGSPAWQAGRVLTVVAVTAALAVWFTRRAGRAGQGAAALLLGIAGTAGGLGVAAGHLTKAGPDAAAVAAAVAGTTSLFPLTWGAVALVRATPGWWRLLAVPVALTVAWFVLFPLTVAVTAVNRPPGPLGPATPAGYRLSYQNVALRTSDGVRLSAWYIPPRNGAAVVLLPGSGATRASVLGQAAVLARHGYGALLLDTRGHGLSGGHTMDFGWWGGRDIAPAVSFLDRQPGVRPGKIALLGESMGGEQALVAAGSDPRVRAVVAEGAEGQQVADHGWLPRGIDGVLTRGMEWVQYTAAGLISGAPRPMSIPDAIRATAPRPVLIIAGGAVADEPVAARWFGAASPATVRVWIVPHAGHTEGLAVAPQAWEARVTGFLDAALNPAASSATGSRGG